MRYRMKRLFAGLLSAVLLLSLLPAMAWAAGDFPSSLGGTGDADDPYQIKNAEQLAQLSEYVNAGNGCSGLFFKLNNNISLEGEWMPIGGRINVFQGTFDGGNFTVSGLSINSGDSSDYVGLFGYIGDGGSVKNLTVAGEVSGRYAGGIVGQNYGTIENCYNAAEVTGTTGDTGGIVGYNSRGTIKNCHNAAKVTGGTHGNTGGIVGNNSGGTIENCDNRAEVTGTDGHIGGIVGNDGGGTIENCYNAAEVTGTDGNIGGIVGDNNSGTIENCDNGSAVTGTGTSGIVGGIAGMSRHAAIRGCCNRGTVSGYFVGGIVGNNSTSSEVKDCYNNGKVNGDGPAAGGIVGISNATIENCYNSGMVSGSTCGGIVGQNTGTATNCFYLDTADKGASFGDSDEMIKKTKKDFASGEVAYLLQSGRSSQIWGQALKGGSDAYPVLTGASEKRVYKVTFCTQSKPEPEGYAVKYANSGGVKELPDAPTLEGMAFDHWSTENSTSSGAKFDGETQVTGDITVYAVGRPTFAGERDTITLTTTYGKGGRKDLSECVAYKLKTPTAGVFNYEITEGNDNLNAKINGDNLEIPENADAREYTLTIEAKEKEPGYSLMSMGPYGTDPVYLTVKVIIQKADSRVETAPTARELTYTGAEQELVTKGTATGGTMQYSLEQNGNYSTDIPKGTEAKEYTVWYKVVGDANHNDSTPQSVTVTIEKADGTGTLTMADFTCKETGVEPEASSETNGPAVITYAEKGTEDFTDQKPDTAGFYTVKAVFPENQNYKELTLTADFKITHQFNAGWEQTEDGEYHLCACGTGLLLETKELSEVPEGLKQNPDVDTVEEIEQVLVEKVATGNHYVIYDVELEAWIGDEWKIITPESLPEEGVAITIPYPAGTNAKYPFTVVHMFTTTGDGHAPGDTEVLKATNETDGIHFTVESFSPIIIGWKTGNLTVTVTDTGEGAGSAQQWQFRVELDDDTIDGTFGDMEFTAGVAEFTLQSGQSLTAQDLPEGLAYTVTELNGNQDGYTTTCTDEQGFTVSGEAKIAAFTNVFAKTEPEPSKSPETSEGPQAPTGRPSGGGSGDYPSGTPNDTPKTGDEGPLFLWLALMVLSLAGAAATAPIMGRKRPVDTNGRH